MPDNELQKIFNDSWNDGEDDDDNDAGETNNAKFETLTTEESTNQIADNVTAEEDNPTLQEQVEDKDENCKDSNESHEVKVYSFFSNSIYIFTKSVHEIHSILQL